MSMQTSQGVPEFIGGIKYLDRPRIILGLPVRRCAGMEHQLTERGTATRPQVMSVG